MLDPLRQQIREDFVIISRIWPMTQLRELLTLAFYLSPVETMMVDRNFATNALNDAVDMLPISSLEDVHKIAAMMCVGGIINWEIPGGRVRIEEGDSPFEILDEYLTDSPATNFDELNDIRRRYEQNPDENTRRLERQASQGNFESKHHYLVARLRSGDLDHNHLIIASFLGDPAARMLVPDPQSELNPMPLAALSFNDPTTRLGWALRSTLLAPEFVLDLLADFVEHTLPFWAARYSNDTPITEAIRAARERVSFEEASKIRSQLLFTEDPYAPAAMAVAEQALALVEMVRYYQEDNIASFYGWASPIPHWLQEAAGMADAPGRSFSLEKKWQLRHFIDSLLISS